MIRKGRVVLAGLLLAAATAVACNSGNFAGANDRAASGDARRAGTGTGGDPTERPGKEKGKLVIPVGDTARVPEPRGGDPGRIVNATSDDDDVATVDPRTGKIEGKSVGKTTVEIEYEDGTVQIVTVEVTDDEGSGKLGTVDDTAQPDIDLAEDEAAKAGEPEGLVTLEGEATATPNLQACAALPARGKTGYGPGQKCPADAVVVIVNDGKAQELTCCPLNGKNVLSSKPEEQYLPRTGRCQGDEVVVGMSSAQGPGLLCSKLNPKLTLTGERTAIYAKNTDLTPLYAAIAADYNIRDTCICTDDTIYVGEHTTQDNRCINECARIIRKK